MKTKEIIQIERKIVIGMIISTKYLKQAVDLIEPKLIQSEEAKILVNWVLAYFKKYKKAPRYDIQSIYLEKLQNKKIEKNQAEIIELILDDLSEESLTKEINIEYLLDQTELYCKACQLKLYAEQIENEIDSGNVLEAEHMLVNFKPIEKIKSNAVIPLKTIKQQREAFESFSKPLIKYPGHIGDFLNQYMVQEGFVVFLGQNKGGKSFLLMDAAFRAATQGKNVAFFQAGDMSQAQMERRQSIYLAKKSDLQKYCGPLYVPVLDCALNQNGSCDYSFREGGKEMEGPFENKDIQKIRTEMTYYELTEAFKDYPKHIPCYNCLRGKPKGSFRGAIWYKKRKKVEPLHWKEIHHLLEKKYKNVRERIRLITYSSESLTMSKMRAETDILEKTGFFPHVVIADYIDLFAPDRDTIGMSTRDQENKKWQRGRAFSQDKKCLFLSASQSDAEGFEKHFLTKKNFSEDRRKLDHVTAMIGINMSVEEKKMGISRLNDITARDTTGTEFVYLMHRLQMGRPILGGFY